MGEGGQSMGGGGGGGGQEGRRREGREDDEMENRIREMDRRERPEDRPDGSQGFLFPFLSPGFSWSSVPQLLTPRCSCISQEPVGGALVL